MKLLIAVRSQAMASMLSSSLPEYDIHICDTAAGAIATLSTLRPKLLILDLRLRGMDGLTAIRKSTHYPQIILALTDLVTEGVLEVAADAGILDVLQLPCTIGHIIEHLDILIENTPSVEV